MTKMVITPRQAKERGWKTVGIACSKAEKYQCFPIDEKIIVGNNWVEESETSLKSIDVLVRVGGGEQAFRETQLAKQRGLEVIEYEIQAF
jgi:hypothetical protein